MPASAPATVWLERGESTFFIGSAPVVFNPNHEEANKMSLERRISDAVYRQRLVDADR